MSLELCTVVDGPERSVHDTSMANRSRNRGPTRARQERARAAEETSRPPERSLPTAGWAAALLIAILIAFSPGLTGPWIMDDVIAIENNESIRDLGDWRAIITPRAGGSTHEGRPLLNLTYAINYAISPEPMGFKLANIVIHWSAAIVLFAVVRRLARLCSTEPREAWMIAAATATCWSFHPLTVQSVSYAAQRAESLAAFSILVSIYLALLALQRPAADKSGEVVSRTPFAVASIVVVYLGILLKEIVVVTPAVLFLIDWLLVFRDWKVAIKKRWWMYASQLPALLVVAVLLAMSGSRGGTIGAGVGAVPVGSLEYFLTQLSVLPRYLIVCFWPQGLIFDYGVFIETKAMPIAVGALVLVGLLVSAWSLRQRWPVYSFAVFAFLVLLSPTSTLIPIASQTVSEHRLYLPVACLIGGVMVCLFQYKSPGVRVVALTAVVGTLAVVTYQRSSDFGSLRALWSDTYNKVPQNRRAYVGYVSLLLAEQELDLANQIIRQTPSPKDDPVSLVLLARIAFERRQDQEVLNLLRRSEELLRGDNVDPHTRELVPPWSQEMFARSSEALGVSPLEPSAP